jgi:outer membrane protein insertion porin family
LTTHDFGRLDASRAIAVLPLAATEQHGPHLPLSVDVDIVNGVLHSAMARLNAGAASTAGTLNKKDLSIKINIEEGRRYYFGNIKFLGNTIYTDKGLRNILGIKKGDVYNGVLLEKRIADKSKPDGEDITNLYQNNGYLFSNINAVEVKTSNDTIDFEIRIVEGPLAYFNNITVIGNDKTNDKVIYR